MLKVYKPTTPARRKTSLVDYSDLSKKEPEKKLTIFLPKTGGRNNQGQITTYHRGGGAKRLYRLIDFKQEKFDVPGEVKAIEYDPNRSAHLALLEYPDKERKYILAPEGIKKGEKIISSRKKIEIKTGNRMPLEFIPSGMFVHNLELRPGKGGEIMRSAGSMGVVMGLEGKWVQIKMPSGEIRNFPKDCQASIGQVSNIDWRNIRWGKAGRRRLKGRRPTVRGKVKNPVDHPHGGGEGNQPIGLAEPQTPWGKPALGVKTRRKGKYSDRFIIKRRK